jgi:bifunctional non-homologous end joining protein LigD
VATPLAWEELGPDLRADRFTVETLPRRLRSLGADPWAELGKLKQTLSARAFRRLGLAA